MNGVCRLTIKSATLEDSGEYVCKINKQTDKTETVLTVVGGCSIIRRDENSNSHIKLVIKILILLVPPAQNTRTNS